MIMHMMLAKSEVWNKKKSKVYNLMTNMPQTIHKFGLSSQIHSTHELYEHE